MSATILVVDDEPGILDLLEWELGTLGHDVTTVAGGAEAIEAIGRMEFDIIISDVRMPEVSGIEVLKTAKTLWPDTEVLITTGFAELDAAIDCVRGDAFDFVMKPFDLHALAATVAKGLERRQLRASTALYRASQAILANVDPQRLPGVIVDVAMKAMEADDVSLMLAGGDDSLYLAEARDLAPEHQREVLTIGSRVAGRVAATRQPALIQNGLATDARFADVPSFHRVRSSIVYPLTVGERLVGVLNINRVTNPWPFRQRDMDKASVLASQVLLALENRRLLHSVAISERLTAIGQIAASVAHEINNPAACVMAGHAFLRDQLDALARLDALFEEGADIRTLRAFREKLGGSSLVQEARHALGDAEEGATRIRDIVRDMRSLVMHEEHPTVVDINEALRSALRVSGAEIRHHAKVITRLGTDTEVLGCAGRLSQVFVNLLVNAAQAMAEHRGERNEIAVTTWREGARVFAEISDTGPGIDPDVLPRLFEAFFTTKGATIGTGLGLSISRDLVRRSGGELRAASAPGLGATFTLELPAANPEREIGANQMPTTGARCMASSRPRILFVDDEGAIRRTYERSFARDYDVVLADGGPQALEILAQRRDFHLIVCDLLMPEMTGMEIYQQARQAYPELERAFVFVTGSIAQGEVQAFLKTGEHQVLEKPFAFARLREIIDARSGRREAASIGAGGMKPHRSEQRPPPRDGL